MCDKAADLKPPLLSHIGWMYCVLVDPLDHCNNRIPTPLYPHLSSHCLDPQISIPYTYFMSWLGANCGEVDVFTFSIPR